MMMNPTASLLYLLLIIATCLSIVNGGALSKDAIEEKLEAKNGNLRTNHTIAEHQTNIRRGGDKIGLVGFKTTTASSSRRRLKSTRLSVVVEFKSKKGKKRATNLARKILYESELFDVIAMEIHSKNLEILREDPDIIRVDIDEKVHAVPIVIDDVDESENEESLYKRKKKDNDTRSLQESIPWGIRAVQADKVTLGPDPVKICIVDTGYDYNHVDLPKAGVTGTDSTQYGGDGRWNVDGEGHGTHIAGTIAALGNNNQGVRGVIDDGRVLLHIGKGLDDKGQGTISNIIEIVEACIRADADIISMSFVPSGGGGFNDSFNSILATAYSRYNMLLVAAAGNNGNSGNAYPASYGSVMSVAAIDSNGRRASFSQYNNQVEISGPGVAVVSTKPGNRYDDSSGTSQATPHVAAVAALVWSYNKSCSATQIRRILLKSALPLGTGGCDTQFGRGLVQAKAAVDMLLAGGCSAADNSGIFEASNGFNTGNTCDNYRAPTTPSTPRPTPAPTPLPTKGSPTPIPTKTPTCKGLYDLWASCLIDEGCFGCVALRKGGGEMSPGLVCDELVDWFPQNVECCSICIQELDDFMECNDCGLPSARSIAVTPEPTSSPATLEPTGAPSLPETDEPTLPERKKPTLPETDEATLEPTKAPSLLETAEPTLNPTLVPTEAPTFAPSTFSAREDIYINAGGRAFVDAQGNEWIADTGMYSTGKTFSTDDNISNTDKTELYQTERNTGMSEMKYIIKLDQPGRYNVSLHFAEIFKGAFAEGSRLIDVYIQGDLVSKELDIFKEAGGEGNKAVVITTPNILVENNFLFIAFVRVDTGHQQPKVNGIEIHLSELLTDAPTIQPSMSPSSQPTLTLTASSMTETPSDEPKDYVLLINAGSPDNYTDPDGNIWVSDEGFYNAGTTFSTDADIANTDKPELYQTERNRLAMTYTVPCPNGLYSVSLHYAEIWQRAFDYDSRVFDVFIQGELIARDLDVFEKAGGRGNAAFVDITENVEVDNGFLAIDFLGVNQHAKINAIEVRQVL